MILGSSSAAETADAIAGSLSSAPTSLRGISTATAATPILTKILRRNLKLAVAQAKRQAASTSTHRVLNLLAGTHTANVSTSTALVSGTASPSVGHPWTIGT